MLHRSRQRHSHRFGFPFRISRLTKHCLPRCCNGSIMHMHSAPCLPIPQIRGPPEICHILKCKVATSSDHGCLRAPPEHMLFIFRFLTSKQTQRRFRSLAVKLPLLCPNTATKKLTEIVSLLGRNLGTVHHFGGGQLVDASSGLDASHVVTSVSCFFSIRLASVLA